MNLSSASDAATHATAPGRAAGARADASNTRANTPGEAILLGVDGGGTGCRARATLPDGTLLGTGAAGPANIYSDAERAHANILAAATAALAAGGLPADDLARCHAGLGLAGANIPAALNAFRARPLPFAAAAVETDAITACRGAFGDADGAIAILGTGTAYVARASGAFTTVGGWGFALADQGGGAHLGRAAFAATLLAHDGLGPASGLTAAILATHGSPAALAEHGRTATPADFGRLAPAVMDAADANDPVATAILAEALAFIERALARLLALGAPAIVLLGGLAPRYRGRVSPPVAARLTEPRGDALDGALLLARTLGAV